MTHMGRSYISPPPPPPRWGEITISPLIVSTYTASSGDGVLVKTWIEAIANTYCGLSRLLASPPPPLPEELWKAVRLTSEYRLLLESDSPHMFITPPPPPHTHPARYTCNTLAYLAEVGQVMAKIRCSLPALLALTHVNALRLYGS